MKYVQKYIYSVVEDKIEKKHQIEYENCRNVNVGGVGQISTEKHTYNLEKIKNKIISIVFNREREKHQLKT